MDATPTEWVLLIKLDSLPYRSGHETWLDDALERVDKYRLFGITGGFPIVDLVPLEDGYSTTQEFSNNFSIFRRSDWLNVIHATIAIVIIRTLQEACNSKEAISITLISTHSINI